jgi:uncharacterized membrane protein
MKEKNKKIVKDITSYTIAPATGAAAGGIAGATVGGAGLALAGTAIALPLILVGLGAGLLVTGGIFIGGKLKKEK